MSQLTRRSFLAIVPAMLASSLSAAEWLRYEPVYRHGRAYPRAGQFSHTEPKWKELRQGLYFSRLTVYRNSEPVDSIGLVKANPEYSRFAVFHDRENQKTIEEWQAHTGAEVTFNSSYYQDTRDPVGLIITGGKMKGPKVNKAMKGMFVAEPVDGRKPKATVLDFAEDKYDYKTAPWTEGVQSFPLLLNSHGNVGVKQSRWHANRTVVCDDNGGNIIVLTAEGGYFSLYEMGQFLKESKLGVVNALNMDGGYEADMIVKTREFNYLTYGQWETQGDHADISVPGIRIPIPAVIGIFPRR